MKRFALLLLTIGFSLNVGAQDGSVQADSFAKIYASTCLKHLSNLDLLISKLETAPSLPPDKAVHFLRGKPGKAWPVPDKNGFFVLAIPNGNNFCAVYAQRVNGPEAITRFQKLVAKAPQPLNSRAVESTNTLTAQNGRANTISYEWSVAGAERKMLFTLTTADSPTADIQGLASAAYVR